MSRLSIENMGLSRAQYNRNIAQMVCPECERFCELIRKEDIPIAGLPRYIEWGNGFKVWIKCYHCGEYMSTDIFLMVRRPVHEPRPRVTLLPESYARKEHFRKGWIKNSVLYADLFWFYRNEFVELLVERLT